MTKIAVIYHSEKGTTLKQAEAIAEGAKAKLFDAKKITDKELEFFDECDALIFGCPTYMGNVTAELKTIMDKTGYRWYKQTWQDKIAGGFTSASYTSGDKLHVLTSITIFAAQHGMIWVGSGDTPQDDESEVNRMGSHLGVMAAAKTVDGVKKVNEGDLLTAKRYGERILKITKKWRG